MGSLSIGHWLIVLVVVVLIFGTKKLGNVGSDLGKAVKGFKDGMRNDDDKQPAASQQSQPQPPQQVADQSTIDVETREKTQTRH